MAYLQKNFHQQDAQESSTPPQPRKRVVFIPNLPCIDLVEDLLTAKACCIHSTDYDKKASAALHCTVHACMHVGIYTV